MPSGIFDPTIPARTCAIATIFFLAIALSVITFRLLRWRAVRRTRSRPCVLLFRAFLFLILPGGLFTMLAAIRVRIRAVRVRVGIRVGLAVVTVPVRTFRVFLLGSVVVELITNQKV
uniref:(northern house mosquito) hypothetical protein n=1 Tax=Culex pipiens TaxID=7175 RepID=A0A8D8FKD2_CULPI